MFSKLEDKIEKTFNWLRIDSDKDEMDFYFKRMFNLNGDIVKPLVWEVHEDKLMNLIKKFIKNKFDYVSTYEYDEGDEQYIYELNNDVYCYYRKYCVVDELINFFEKEIENFDFEIFDLEFDTSSFPFITKELEIINKQVDELIVLFKKELMNRKKSARK